MLESHIQKQNTNYRESINPEQRLMICLQFLSTGDTFTIIGFSFRIGITTIELIVVDTCTAIWECLHERYMPIPNETTWNGVSRRYEMHEMFLIV